MPSHFPLHYPVPSSVNVVATSQLFNLPSSGIFQPINISPSVLPNYPDLGKTLPPMYPSFPKTYKPFLTGRCPFNFSSISSIIDKTASDCTSLLASFVGNVICCPQLASSLHIFQGHFGKNSDSLVLQNTTVADDCFSDLVEVLASKGANNSVPLMCSFKSSNLTGGLCPIKDVNTFEKMVNTSKLLDACSVIDPLKECCRSVCQPAIMEAAFKISSSQLVVNTNMDTGLGLSTHVDVLNDCKGVVYSWLSRKLPSEDADSSFRILSACKVNKVCPLELKDPVEVIKACRNVSNDPSCCNSLNLYIAGIQRQMLITNKQAIICASFLGSMLRKGGVLTNVYELCDVDLKDFSLQAYGEEGCLLRSLPADVVYDNSSGFSFTCDLSDNIDAPWPSSSSMESFSLCAPEMSLPALQTSATIYSGCKWFLLELFIIVALLFVIPLND